MLSSIFDGSLPYDDTMVMSFLLVEGRLFCDYDLVGK